MIDLYPTEQKVYDLLRTLITRSPCKSVRIGQQHLGAMLDLTHQTAYRNIGNLKAKGLIRIERSWGENRYFLAGHHE